MVLGVLATFAMPGFYSGKLKTHDILARSMLATLKDAERMHHLEQGGPYLDCGPTTDCNSQLDLDLPLSKAEGGGNYWDYWVIDSSDSDFCAQAIHDDNVEWYITVNDNKALPGDCP